MAISRPSMIGLLWLFSLIEPLQALLETKTQLLPYPAECYFQNNKKKNFFAKDEKLFKNRTSVAGMIE